MRLEKQQKLLELETQALNQKYPSLQLYMSDDGSAFIKGSIEIEQDISYSVKLYLTAEYPRREPILICNRAEIPWTLDRHVFPSNGSACLCVRSETRIHWSRGSDITAFIDKLVIPFFVWQNYYESYGEPPPSGERSHFGPGIIESYKDILCPINDITEKQIHHFMKLLSRKKEPAGHELCPCLSGKKLRFCHRKFLQDLRCKIDPRHALLDMNEAFPKKKKILC